MNEGQSHSINTTAINITQWQTKIDWQLTHQSQGPIQDASLLHGTVIKIIQVLGFQSLCSVISAAVFCQGSKISCGHCHWRWYMCSSQHSGNRMCHNRMRNPWSQRTKNSRLWSHMMKWFLLYLGNTSVVCSHISSKKVQQPIQLHVVQQWTVLKSGHSM